MKDAADPGGMSGGATEAEGTPGAFDQVSSADAASFASARVVGEMEGGAGSSTGPAR